MREKKENEETYVYAFVDACLISFVDLGTSFAKKK